MRLMLMAGAFLSTSALAFAIKPTSPQPIGRITAAFGSSEIHSGQQSRAGDLFAAIHDSERIVTGEAGLSLLLQTRVVIKLDAATSLSISEGVGQTNAALERGTVHVFAGKRAASMGTARVQDALASVEGTNAVFLASYDSQRKESYYACEHGAVTIELREGGDRAVLNADEQAIVRDNVCTVQSLDRALYNQHKRLLDRLGETVVQQGADTQRTRSNARDTQAALTQLAAAGWIDRELLVRAGIPNNTATASENTAKAVSNANSGSSAQTPSGGGDTIVDTPQNTIDLGPDFVVNPEPLPDVKPEKNSQKPNKENRGRGNDVKLPDLKDIPKFDDVQKTLKPTEKQSREADKQAREAAEKARKAIEKARELAEKTDRRKGKD